MRFFRFLPLMVVLVFPVLTLSPLGYAKQGFEKMDESEYNRQKRESDKQRQELIERRKKEAGVSPANENSANGSTGGAPPKSGAEKIPLKQNSSASKQDGQNSGGGETVIKRKSEDETKPRSENIITFNPPTKKTCSAQSFGVCQ